MGAQVSWFKVNLKKNIDSLFITLANIASLSTSLPQVKRAVRAVYIFCIMVVTLRSLLNATLSFEPISNVINSLEGLNSVGGGNLLPLMTIVSSVCLVLHLKAYLLKTVCEKSLCK